MSSTFDRELFERAFSAHVGTCRRTCACGVEYYDNVNSYSWEQGELKSLRENPKAVSLPYSVSILNIEGREFVADCNCWVDRAKAITEWLDRNGYQITAWYNLRKQAAATAAANMPEVKP